MRVSSHLYVQISTTTAHPSEIWQNQGVHILPGFSRLDVWRHLGEPFCFALGRVLLSATKSIVVTWHAIFNFASQNCGDTAEQCCQGLSSRLVFALTHGLRERRNSSVFIVKN